MCNQQPVKPVLVSLTVSQSQPSFVTKTARRNWASEGVGIAKTETSDLRLFVLELNRTRYWIVLRSLKITAMLTAVSHANRSFILPLRKTRVGSRFTVRYGKLLRSSLHSSSQVIFSGIQPTGIPHIGNYLGALQQWVRLQNEAPPNTQLIFSIVDLHAITVNQDAKQLQIWKRQTLAALLSVGLDPNRAIIFFQSSVWLPGLGGPDGRIVVKFVPGTSSYGAHVDTWLHRVHRLSVQDDTVEGE